MRAEVIPQGAGICHERLGYAKSFLYLVFHSEWLGDDGGMVGCDTLQADGS